MPVFSIPAPGSSAAVTGFTQGAGGAISKSTPLGAERAGGLPGSWFSVAPTAVARKRIAPRQGTIFTAQFYYNPGQRRGFIFSWRAPENFSPAGEPFPRLVVALKGMKTFHLFLAALGGLALAPGLTHGAQTAPASKPRDITTWVSGSPGSLLGRGYTSTYLTNIRARTIAKEEKALRDAIVTLEALGMTPVRGFGLVPAAVAWQSKLPMRKVIQQQAATRLSYGELLLANVLADRSKRSFEQVVAMRGGTRTWGELANALDVSPGFLVSRVQIASQRIRLVESSISRRPMNDGGTNLASANPHTKRAHHR